MATQVAPEQEAMAGLKAQPKVPGNGCCMCCGGAPPDIDVRKITALGGKYAQADDGRIIEYYTYGSEDSDAQTLLQINGSCGSARLFSRMTGMVKVMKDLKIRGISISLPGHGFSSNHPSRQIGNWPREDVRPVFEKEQIHSTFMVEGMSFGSSHAMAVMHEFPDRVTRAHLLVPYLPVELRRQEGWKLYGQDDSFRCQYPWVSSCWPRACCLFCCCSMCFDFCGAANMAVSDVKKHDKDVGYTLSTIQAEDIRHAHAASIHGFIYNALVPMTSMNWGFSPKDTDVSKMRVLVSYGQEDKQSPPEHGKFLGEMYMQKAAKCVVNISNGGHGAHHIPFGRGELLRLMLSV